MAAFERISITTANDMIASGKPIVVDVRDEQSYTSAHIPGATHLDNTNLQDFLDSADPAVPVIVYCYHGNSSQGAAALLTEKGFANAYSMDGGFEEWRGQFPVENS